MKKRNIKKGLNLGGLLSTIVTGFAALPYELGEIAIIIPPDWKPFVVKVGFCCIIIAKGLSWFIKDEDKN